MDRLDSKRAHPVLSEPLAGILRHALESGASDLHLAAGVMPTARVHGTLIPLPFAEISAEAIAMFCGQLLAAPVLAAIEAGGGHDCSFEAPGGVRCRAHVFRQRNSYAMALRFLTDGPGDAPATAAEGWASYAAGLKRGLVLVTGATGSGKTTTLASLIDRINRERSVHIVTIEDPIERLHLPRQALITQRELHSDTSSFAEALRAVLRQDPDVVLIGEIRDRETLEATLTVAETGHLVFSTLHTGSAAQAVQRMLDMFAPQDQAPIRAQMSMVLEVVVFQQLLPRADHRGRVLAAEVLRVTGAIRNLIREGKTHQLENMMQLGQSSSGTRTMLQALVDLHDQGLILYDDAVAYAHDAEAMRAALASSLDGNRRERSNGHRD